MSTRSEPWRAGRALGVDRHARGVPDVGDGAVGSQSQGQEDLSPQWGWCQHRVLVAGSDLGGGEGGWGRMWNPGFSGKLNQKDVS